MNQEGERSYSEEGAAPSENAAPEFVIPVQIIEGPEEAKARQRGKAESRQLQKDDLEAQQAMSKATWVIVWLTVANLVCVSLGTGLLIWTLCLTRGANKAAFKAVQVAVSQCRPWLKIDLEPIKVAHDKDTGRIKLSVRLTLENIGQSPAVDVRVYVLAYAWQVPLKTPIEKQAFVGARKRFSRFDGTDSFYGAIFPGDRRENRFETSAKTDLVLHPALTDAGRAMYEEKMTYDRIAPIVSFVITYKATGHDEDFTTEWGIGITSDGWNGFPLSPGDEVTNLVGTPHPPYMKAN